MHNDIASVLLSEEQIRERIRQLGQELLRDYADKNPIFVGVLKGVVIFYADMVRAFDAPCQMELMRLASYSGTQSTGNMELLQDLKADIASRHVVILEDIVDSGRSLQYLCGLLKERSPASLKICALLDKPEGRAEGIQLQADYVGFTVPNEFVVGFGLDYNEKYRNLPYVGILKPEVYLNQGEA